MIIEDFRKFLLKNGFIKVAACTPQIRVADCDFNTTNIIENLKETRQNKSTIITAHRLSAVVHADLILVLQDGHIIEHGRHEELIEQGGWYADTYEAQQLEMEGDADEE